MSKGGWNTTKFKQLEDLDKDLEESFGSKREIRTYQDILALEKEKEELLNGYTDIIQQPNLRQEQEYLKNVLDIEPEDND